MVILFTLAGVLFLSSVITLSARGERLRRRVVLALERSGISRKEAAITMRLTEQRLSEALNGRSPLSVFRLADLPDEFWDAFDEIGVDERGRGVVVPAVVAKLVRSVGDLVATADPFTRQLPPGPLQTQTVTLPMERAS